MAQDKQALLQTLQKPLSRARGLVRELWQFAANDWVDSIGCCDVNQDREPEIIIGSEDGVVYLLSASGQKLWHYKIGSKVSSVLAADLDGNGQIEIVAGSEDRHVYILSCQGELQRRIRIGHIVSSMAIFQDGPHQFIAVGTEGNELVVLDGQGKRQWVFDASDWVFCVVAHILQGQPMLVIGGRNDRLYALDRLGQAVWTYEAGDWIFSACIADVDGDGVNEVIAGSRDNAVHVLNERGELKYKVKLRDWVMNVSVADVDGDGYPEIIAGSADGRLTIIDGDGHIKWRFDAADRMHSLACCDVNFDQRIEILVGLDSNLVRVFRMDPPEALYNQLSAFTEGLNELTRTDLPQSDWDILTALLPDVTPAEPDPTEGLSPEELALYRALESRQRHLVKVWEAPTEDRVRSLYLASTPGGDARIVVGCDDNHVYLLDGRGRLLWRRKLDGKVRKVYAADLNADGEMEILAGSESGRLSILSLDGEELHTYQMSHGIGSVVAADTCGDGHLHQVVGLLDQDVECLDFPDGNLCWSYTTGKWISGLDAGDIDDCGRAEVAVASNDNYVHFLGGDGQVRWKYQTGNWTRAVQIDTLNGEQVVVAGSDDHFVHVLDRLGHVLWKYETGNRVRAVQIYDVDLDGKQEVVIGSADFCVYVLDGAGNLKWTFDAGSWVRSIVCSDLDGDDQVEFVVGSELKRVIAYRVQDPESTTQAVKQAWQDLLAAAPSGEKAQDRPLSSSSPLIRAHALRQVVTDPSTPAEQALGVVEHGISDADTEVRLACAGSLLALLHKGVAPETLKRLIEASASDEQRAVRIVLANELADIAHLNPVLAFSYLAELGTDPDRWVRRRVIRNLTQLAERYPSQTLKLLLPSLADASDWIQLEGAMALADFLDHYPGTTLSHLESVAEVGAETGLAKVGDYLKQPALQTTARTFALLMAGQLDSDVIEALRQLNTLLEGKTQFGDAQSTREFTVVLQGLCEARTVEEIVDLLSRAGTLPSPVLQFTRRVHQFLQQADKLADALTKHQRREALFDRAGYLLEASSRLESVQTFCQEMWAEAPSKACLERNAIELGLSRARTIIADALTQLRGAANLDVRLGSQQLIKEEAVVLTVIVNNIGSAPAENLRIQLAADRDFKILGPESISSDFVPAHGTAQFEFTVHPTREQHRFLFDIHYDDFSQKDNQLQFADQIRFSEAPDILKPITNPYVAGKPIRSERMFFGRRDTIEMIKATLQKSGQSNVLVLHGERRFGKTSILYQLRRELTEPLIPVYIDMQRLAGADTAGLLRRIGRFIMSSLPDGHADDLLPSKSEFDTDPFFTFDEFLDAIEDSLPPGSKLVLMVDEFELLEDKVKSGRIDPEIFGYFRSLMQHRATLNFIFTGTHTLELLSRDYWSVFFNIALPQKISFLEEESAERLITEPVTGQLTYDPLAVDKIKTLTANHPYFIQLICNGLVWHCKNHQRAYATVADVNAVIKDILETSVGHIQFVWLNSDPNEKLVLSALAANQKSPESVVTLSDIQRTLKANSLTFDLAKCQHAIRNLIQRDLVREATGRGDGFCIIIDLIRLWLRENKAPGHVVGLEGVRPTDYDPSDSGSI